MSTNGKVWLPTDAKILRVSQLSQVAEEGPNASSRSTRLLWGMPWKRCRWQQVFQYAVTDCSWDPSLEKQGRGHWRHCPPGYDVIRFHAGCWPMKNLIRNHRCLHWSCGSHGLQVKSNPCPTSVKLYCNGAMPIHLLVIQRSFCAKICHRDCTACKVNSLYYRALHRAISVPPVSLLHCPTSSLSWFLYCHVGHHVVWWRC